MLRRIAITCITAVIAALLTIITPSTTVAQFKGECKPSVGLAQVDPIVDRDGTPSSHNHEFFGNTAILNKTIVPDPTRARYADMLRGGTNCERPTESALYWFPTLHKGVGAAPERAFRFFSYYKAFNGNMTGPANPFPRDIRMVSDRYRWHCGKASSMPQERDAIPRCGQAKGKVFLTLSIRFPSCWDGRKTGRGMVNTSDYSPAFTTENHLAFPQGNTCPTGFPIKLPNLRITVGWGDGTAGYWRGTNPLLSSDLHTPGTIRGTTAHADFWNTWRQPAHERFIRQCVNRFSGPKLCGSPT